MQLLFGLRAEFEGGRRVSTTTTAATLLDQGQQDAPPPNKRGRYAARASRYITVENLQSCCEQIDACLRATIVASKNEESRYLGCICTDVSDF
eukprot:6181640-Pleurochrysis_carterae.AAC.2